MKRLLAYIDLDLEEVLDSEYAYQLKIQKQYDKIQERIEEIIRLTEIELELLSPNLEKLENLRIAYQELLYIRYEFQKQYLIGSETIASIYLEEIEN